MEENEIIIHILVLMTLLSLLGVVFYISQDINTISVTEKTLYGISTIILFAFLASAFMRDYELNVKLSVFFNVFAFLSISYNLLNAWMPLWIRISSFSIIFISLLVSLKILYSMRKRNQISTITTIDLTKSNEINNGKRKVKVTASKLKSESKVKKAGSKKIINNKEKINKNKKILTKKIPNKKSSKK
jgi:hypothetical protein